MSISPARRPVGLYVSAALVAVLFSALPWLVWSPIVLAQPADDPIPVSTGLIDGQEVVISGSDVPPNRQVAIVPCRGDTTDAEGCDLSALRIVSADQFGRFETAITVYRRISVGGEAIDCAPNNCLIGVGLLPERPDGRSYERANAVRISFDPNAPLLPEPTLKLSKTTKLRNGQRVKVTGEVFPPDTGVGLQICAGSIGTPTFGCRSVGEAFTNGKGTFKTTVKVSRTVFADGKRVDCAKRNACHFVAQSWNGQIRGRAQADMRFSNDGPLPPEPVLRLNQRKISSMAK